MRQLETSLRHLVKLPRDGGRRRHNRPAARQLMPVAWPRRDPAGAGDHVAELWIEPVLGSAALIQFAIEPIDDLRDGVGLRRQPRLRGVRRWTILARRILRWTVLASTLCSRSE